MRSRTQEPGLRGCRSLLALALVLAGALGCDEQSDPPPDEPVIVWGECPPLPDGASRDPRQVCGTLQVPLDHGRPDGPSLELAVSRIATATAGSRRGVLLLNPGGPGLPGLELPSADVGALPAEILERYDLIGFDPRGVGHSSPVTCGLTDGVNIGTLFPYPAADGSIDANVELARDTAAACAASASAEILPFITTLNTARDLDHIRRALGEETLSYWGQSYGTYLGAVYASLFPTKVDRMVLEGNVDPAIGWYGFAQTWGPGMASRFPDAAEVAAAHDDTLHLGATAAAVTAAYLALAGQLDATPAAIPGADAHITGGLLRAITYALLEHDEQLLILARFWRATADLAAGALTEEDIAILGQIFAPTPPQADVPDDNQTAVFLALTCGDTGWPTDPAIYARNTATNRMAYPLTAGMPSNIWPCAFLPAPREASPAVTREGARHVLLLQNRRDNATPWESGLGMRTALGPRAVFVGLDAGGHYVYGRGASCVDDAFDAFLVSGALPDDDVMCTLDP